MPEGWTTAAIYVLATLGPVGALLAWIAKLRWSNEYRAVVEARITALGEVVRSKEAQISLHEQTLKAKDVSIEAYKAMSYADAQKQLNAQRESFDGRIAEHERQLSDLACQLEAKATELSKAQAESTSLGVMVEQSAALTRQAGGDAVAGRSNLSGLRRTRRSADGPR